LESFHIAVSVALLLYTLLAVDPFLKCVHAVDTGLRGVSSYSAEGTRGALRAIDTEAGLVIQILVFLTHEARRRAREGDGIVRTGFTPK
jgi:hypothetical protein